MEDVRTYGEWGVCCPTSHFYGWPIPQGRLGWLDYHIEVGTTVSLVLGRQYVKLGGIDLVFVLLCCLVLY